MLHPLSGPTSKLTTDASGNWGCGAFSEEKWFQLSWPDSIADCHISIKELTPVVLATAVWGKEWEGHTVLIYSDNSTAVAAINNQTLKVKELAHLLRCLSFLSAHHQCNLIAFHLPGQHNTLTDALSRNNLSLFHSLHPQASP